jgi:hypothetical protein
VELLFKVPQGKPPVIAVVFESAKEACELNQDLVNDYADLLYTLQFRGSSSSEGITFVLGNERLKGLRNYRGVKYDQKKLENFLFVTRTAKQILFLHLLHDFDRYFTVTTLDKYKKFELKLERIIYLI